TPARQRRARPWLRRREVVAAPRHEGAPRARLGGVPRRPPRHGRVDGRRHDARLARGPPVLWGTSMGAAAVLRAVSRRTPARGLVLEAPFPRLIDAVRSRFAIMGAPSFPSAELLVFWGGVRGGFDGFALEPVEWARSARAPALVLHGEADPTVSVEQVREVAGALAGPKTLVTFPGVGHESPLSARPAGAREPVARFLCGL